MRSFFHVNIWRSMTQWELISFCSILWCLFVVNIGTLLNLLAMTKLICFSTEYTWRILTSNLQKIDRNTTHNNFKRNENFRNTRWLDERLEVFSIVYINFISSLNPSVHKCKITTVEECIFIEHVVIFVLLLIKLHSLGDDF